MTIKANSPEQYIDNLREDRKPVMKKLRQIILESTLIKKY